MPTLLRIAAFSVLALACTTCKTEVGPGASAAKLAIAPRDTAILITRSVSFHFSLTDSRSAAVSGITLKWSVSDPTLATIDDAGGLMPTGKQGKAFVLASASNGLRDSTTITIMAQPTRLVVLSGAGQTGAVTTTLAQPWIVQTQAADGTPVAGVPVAFAAPAAGTVSPAGAVSDATGRAQATLTLGTTAGVETFTATSTGLTGTSANETATAAAVALLVKISGDAQTDTVGKTLAQPFVVKVTDTFGNAVSGATVNWARVAGAGSVSAPTAISDVNGLATVAYSLGTIPRTDTVSATLSAIPTSSVFFTAVGVPRAATTIVQVSGDRQAAPGGTVLPSALVVKVTDGGGNPSPGATVTWAVIFGGGTVSRTSSVTAPDGTTSTVLTLASAAGLNQVRASIVSSGPAVVFNETGLAGAPAILVKIAGDGQVATPGSLLPVKPAVKLTDAVGNGVPGQGATFSITAGGGSVSGAAQVTDASGVATVGGWTLGPVGPQSLKAVAGGLTVTFNASASGAVGAHFDAAADFSSTSNPNGPWSAGWTATLGSAFTVYPSNVVSGSFLSWVDPAINTLTTPAFQKNVSGAATLGAAPGQVALHPGCNALEYSELRWTAPSAGSYLASVQFLAGDIGNTDAAVLVNGASAFTAASTGTNSTYSTFLAMAAGDRIQAAVGTGGDGCFNDNTPILFTVLATSSVSINANSVASQSTTAGTAVAAPPSVIVRDGVGNPVAGVTVTFVVTAGGGSLVAAAQVTDASGVATVGAWILGAAPGANTVTANVPGVTSLSFSATGT